MAKDENEKKPEKPVEKTDAERQVNEKRSSQNMLEEVDKERREKPASKEKQNNNSETNADKLLGSQTNFEVVAKDKPIGKPNEVIEYKSGDKTEKLELDDSGMPKKFTDRSGETIEKDKDGNWIKIGILSPKGEPLENFSVDAEHNISITYRVAVDENKTDAGNNFVKRVIKPDGTEETSYSTSGDNKVSSPDYQTRLTRDGEYKSLDAIKDGKVIQSAKFKGDDLVSFAAPDKTKYDLVGSEGGKYWQKTSPDGTVTKVAGNVKVDNDGTAFVENKNETTKEFQTQRFLANGTRINSPIDASSRTITTAEGEVFKRDSSNPKVPTFTKTTADGNVVTITQSELKNSTEKLERRAIRQELPENWQELLKERLSIADNPLFSQDGPTAAAGKGLLYEYTVDGGAWDDKAKGSQFQAWGNVAWGMYAAQMNMPYKDALWWNGAVKTANGKNAGHPEWGSPIDWYTHPHSKERQTYGQNPADADLIKVGYEQFDQYRTPTSYSNKVIKKAGEWSSLVPLLDPITNPFLIH